jgi:hypothetical protein
VPIPIYGTVEAITNKFLLATPSTKIKATINVRIINPANEKVRLFANDRKESRKHNCPARIGITKGLLNKLCSNLPSAKSLYSNCPIIFGASDAMLTKQSKKVHNKETLISLNIKR